MCHKAAQTSDSVEVWSTYSAVSDKHSKAEGQNSRSEGRPPALCLHVPFELQVKKK